MKYYRSNKVVILFIDILSMGISFIIAFTARYREMMREIGVELLFMYIGFFIAACGIYAVLYLIREKPNLEKQSYKEIWLEVFVQQFIFITIYVLMFFLFHKMFFVSRVYIGLFFVGNTLFDGIGRTFYRIYCVKKSFQSQGDLGINTASDNSISGSTDEADDSAYVRHCYICGAKSIGQYGGFETFVMNLLLQHKDNPRIKYHIACKANGEGFMDVESLPGAEMVNDSEFAYCNAHGFLISIPEKLGAAQAVYYDIKALKYICNHIQRNHIESPIVYILASRIGLFEKKYVRQLHNAGGQIFQNPDGHENWRRKWSAPIRRYWKISEKYAVKYADLVVCDSKNIEKYIQEEYAQYTPKTTYLAYGSDIIPSTLSDDDQKYMNWLTSHNLKNGEFYISVGRFVPENNFDIMIREFMNSKTTKDFAIITTDNPKYAKELQQKYHFNKDKRIKFVGTVYDSDLLKKIRENAYGYLHGHEVGGTNPSLLESLGSTKLNLLLDVGFNREVAEDGALYWNKSEGSLSEVINVSDLMSSEERDRYGEKARKQITDEYSWQKIGDEYAQLFLNRMSN